MWTQMRSRMARIGLKDRIAVRPESFYLKRVPA